MTFIISLETMAYEVSSQEETSRKGPWFEEEDETLTAAVALLGARRWDALAKASGLRRSGKSCMLRWLNYLHPNLKHGEITAEEELVIMQLHKLWGNKWAKIARRLPGRTDNEVKNYWRSHLSKKLIHAKEQEDFGANVINDEKQNSLVPISDGRPTNSYLGHCTYEMDDILWTSVDPSCAFNELSNIDFGSSPCNARVSDMISSCWSYEQSEAKHHDSHSRECLGLYACFCYPCWSCEEEKSATIWDCSSSLWR